MTAGVKIYNGNRQVLVDDTYQNLALSSVINMGADKGAWSWDSSTVDFSYKGNIPVLVYEIGGINNRLYVAKTKQQSDGSYAVKYVQAPADKVNKPCTFYVFDNPQNAIINGQAALKIYNPNTGQLTFDSRLKHLQILGEIYDGMPIDPSRKYGVLLRSKLGFHYEWISKVSGGKWYVDEYWRSDLIWIEGNVIRVGRALIRERHNWYWLSTGNPSPSLSYDYPQLATPLLVDLTLI